MGASARHQGGGSQAALAGSVGPFRGLFSVHTAGLSLLLKPSAGLAHWQSCGRAPTLSQQTADA